MCKEKEKPSEINSSIGKSICLGNKSPFNITITAKTIDGKVIFNLPDGNFKYQIVKGNGIQTRILDESEDYECSVCGFVYCNYDATAYYEDGDLFCPDCWMEGAEAKDNEDGDRDGDE